MLKRDREPHMTYRWPFALVPVLVLFAVSATGAVSQETFTGVVTGVPSADVLEVPLSGVTIKVELWGVIALKPGQYYADKALSYLKARCLGQTVTVRVMENTGYDSRIGYVTLPDGRKINQELVKYGYAWWSRGEAPSDTYLKRYFEEAQRKRLGIWSQPNPIPPWEFSDEDIPEAPGVILDRIQKSQAGGDVSRDDLRNQIEKWRAARRMSDRTNEFTTSDPVLLERMQEPAPTDVSGSDAAASDDAAYVEEEKLKFHHQEWALIQFMAKRAMEQAGINVENAEDAPLPAYRDHLQDAIDEFKAEQRLIHRVDLPDAARTVVDRGASYGADERVAAALSKWMTVSSANGGVPVPGEILNRTAKLFSGDSRTRIEAARALVGVGREVEPLIPVLVHAAHHLNWQPSGFRILNEAYIDNGPSTTRVQTIEGNATKLEIPGAVVAQAIVDIGNPAVPYLCYTLLPAYKYSKRDRIDPNGPDYRFVSAWILGEIGDPAAVDPLMAVLQNGELYSSWAMAAEALGKIGDPSAMDVLVGALQAAGQGLAVHEIPGRKHRPNGDPDVVIQEESISMHARNALLKFDHDVVAAKLRETLEQRNIGERGRHPISLLLDMEGDRAVPDAIRYLEKLHPSQHVNTVMYVVKLLGEQKDPRALVPIQRKFMDMNSRDQQLFGDSIRETVAKLAKTEADQ